MFLGHFGVAFSAKKIAPSVSLGTLFLAAQFVDLLWPAFLLLGIERVAIVPDITSVTPLDFEHYPYSHSLLMVFVWAVAFALVYHITRRSHRGAIVVGIVVVSHWFLDLLVHRPDLPLYPGSSPLMGIGLWDSLAATLALEIAIFGGGLWLYLRTTRARDAIGHWALWGLVAFLLVIYSANAFGPPPPSVGAIAWAGNAMWLLIVWGYWIDRHRSAPGPVPKPGDHKGT
jgi:FtsH-binding integral membrane protein